MIKVDKTGQYRLKYTGKIDEGFQLHPPLLFVNCYFSLRLVLVL